MVVEQSAYAPRAALMTTTFIEVYVDEAFHVIKIQKSEASLNTGLHISYCITESTQADMILDM